MTFYTGCHEMRRPASCALRPIASILAALAAILICLGASPAAAQTVTLEHNHPAATMQLSSARRAASYRRLNLKAFLALRNQADLDKLLADQQTPGSSEYQH